MTKQPTSNIEHPTPSDQENAAWVLHEGATGNDHRFDLENRLLEYAAAVIDLSEKLPDSRAANHVAGQILRSGTSPYPNHGEAEDAESREDVVRKLKLCLKELRETRRWARLIARKAWARDDATLRVVLAESDELIRIFYSSIQTARRNALTVERRRTHRSSLDPTT